MSAAASSPAAPVAAAVAGEPASWPDEVWAESVSWCDTVLRTCYGIYEFTDDPACVLRVGLSRTRSALSLADGTRVEAGDVIGVLHFWNEHLPRYTRHGPSLAWARAMHNQVVGSLCALAAHVEADNAWREVRALRAEAALYSRQRPRPHRVAQRYGFEQIATERSLLRRAHDLGDDCLLWGLARAFNPAALARLPFRRDHRELWISRTRLLHEYLPR